MAIINGCILHLTGLIDTPIVMYGYQKYYRPCKKMFSQYPVITITGPRQRGKTTLAKSCFPHLPYKNLEHLETRQFAMEDPVAFLKAIPDGAIIDDIIPIEIKASGTMRNDYFTEYISPSHTKILIYDGDRNEERSRAVVTNVRDLPGWLL